MGSEGARRRTAIARRMHAAFGPGVRVDSLVVDHLDVIPASLLARLAPSLAASTRIVDATHDRVVGIVSAGSVAAKAERVLLTRLARGLVLAPGRDADELPKGELAFLEARADGVPVTAYLALEAFAPDASEPLESVASAPIVVAVLAGRTRLDVESLRALALGDVVVADDDYRAALHVVAGGRELSPRLALHDGELRVLPRTTETDRPTMPHPDETPDGSDDSLVSIASIPVELSIELARVQTSVGELAALVPGAVLATSQALGHHVVLRTQGRAVARGELVEIDGELGVRITEVSARG